jgi:hypothetical protein
MRTGHPQLINSKPKEPATPFRIGERVRMKACPESPPGIVRGIERKRICVFWSDLNYTGKHAPESLTLAGSKEE